MESQFSGNEGSLLDKLVRDFPGLDIEEQIAECIAMLDSAEHLKNGADELYRARLYWLKKIQNRDA